MPIHLEREPAKTPRVSVRAHGADALTIGLVNNMPDAALRATERQFTGLLGAAAGDLRVRLKLYALPDVPRTDWGRQHVERFYAGLGDLWNARLDGLIVTGTEPRSPNLREEPYWDSLTRVLEWAEHNTYSAVWSCLATHAALLELDGIERRPLSDKRFGVFECERIGEHPLTAAAPPRLQMPHSRWNDLPEDALTSCGYQLLTRSSEAGVDAFVKQRKSLFVFFQGHPEYEAHTLMLEYRRDIKRFLLHERASYPPMPHGYFDEATVEALTALRERALSDRREEVLADFPTALAAGSVTNSWRSTAIAVYRNWLQHMRARKQTERRRVVAAGIDERA
jgi:homoserine O-succinyltransferase/O-acetyltransferase